MDPLENQSNYPTEWRLAAIGFLNCYTGPEKYIGQITAATAGDLIKETVMLPGVPLRHILCGLTHSAASEHNSAGSTDRCSGIQKGNIVIIRG